jgi:hypothetical protein
MFTHPLLADDDGPEWHLVTLRFMPQQASNLAPYRYLGICSPRRLFPWTAEHAEVLPATNVVCRARPFPIPGDDVEEPDGVADAQVRALIKRLGRCLFLQGPLWVAGE